MKKLFIILAILFIVSSLDAKVIRRSTFEIGTKASLYIGDAVDNVGLGLGVEVIVNPMRSIGFRIDLTEFLIADNTSFVFNHGGSFDALFYLPTRTLNLYIHTGFGLATNGNTGLSIRGGVGLVHSWSRSSNLFIEPGIIITDREDAPEDAPTEVTFRLSAGARFGIFR